MELVLWSLFCVAVGVALHAFLMRRLIRSLWQTLTDYYYSEHIYPLMKTNRDRATQRELAWDEFRKRFLRL